MASTIQLEWKETVEGWEAQDNYGVNYSFSRPDWSTTYIAEVNDTFKYESRVPDANSYDLGYQLFTAISAREWCESEAYLVDVALRSHNHPSFKWYHTQLDAEAKEMRKLDG